MAKLAGQAGVHDCGAYLFFNGERNCIKSFRVRCCYSGQDQYGGGDFRLMSLSSDSTQPFSFRNHLCRFYFQPRTYGGPAAGATPQENKLLSWITNSADHRMPQVTKLCDARPNQWYTVEAEFDWDTSTAIVSVDGVRSTQPLAFNKFPLRSLYIGNYSRFTSHFGAIDIEYYEASSRQRFQEHFLGSILPGHGL